MCTSCTCTRSAEARSTKPGSCIPVPVNSRFAYTGGNPSTASAPSSASIPNGWSSGGSGCSGGAHLCAVTSSILPACPDLVNAPPLLPLLGHLVAGRRPTAASRIPSGGRYFVERSGTKSRASPAEQTRNATGLAGATINVPMSRGVDRSRPCPVSDRRAPHPPLERVPAMEPAKAHRIRRRGDSHRVDAVLGAIVRRHPRSYREQPTALHRCADRLRGQRVPRLFWRGVPIPPTTAHASDRTDAGRHRRLRSAHLYGCSELRYADSHVISARKKPVHWTGFLHVRP